jgi:hypothetical protein
MDYFLLVVAEDAAILENMGDCDLPHGTIAPTLQGEGLDLPPKPGLGRCLVYR